MKIINKMNQKLFLRIEFNRHIFKIKKRKYLSELGFILNYGLI